MMDHEMTEKDWKEMYMILMSGITDALDQMPLEKGDAPARARLTEALRDAEERYITAGET